MNPAHAQAPVLLAAMAAPSLPALIVGLVGLVASLLLTPLVRTIAMRLGAVDEPGARRVHDGVVPRLGGVAVYLSFWIGVAVFTSGHTWATEELALLRGFAAGSLILVVVGLYDDLRDAPAWLRFCFQFLAAEIMYLSGVHFHPVSVLTPVLGVWATSTLEHGLTLFWISGLINALNFMDGLDFLCTGMSLATVVALAGLSMVAGQVSFLPLYLVLVGALVGFGAFNRSPASIFLGDSGSTFLGLFLSCFSLVESHRSAAGALSPLVPLMLLAIPLFDTFYAIGRRLWLGVSPLSADRGHLHHRLLAVLGSPRRAVQAICFATATCGAVAVGISASGTPAGAALLIVAAAAALVAVRALSLFDPAVIRAGRCNETCSGTERPVSNP